MSEQSVWVQFVDPARPDWKFEFDVEFLTSAYGCIFGNGCKGTDENLPDMGCCPDGVYLVEDADDEAGRENVKMLEARVAQMDEDDWQNKPLADKIGWNKSWGSVVHTRVRQGACIFANRGDHPAGAGCAFHIAAERRGEDPLDWKPRNCWMVPLQMFVDEDEQVTTIRRFQNKADWGSDKSEVCHWWCVDDEIAYVHDTPLYQRVPGELERLVGKDVHTQLIAYLDRYMQMQDGPGRTPVNFRGKRTRTPANGVTGTPLPMAPRA